MIIINFKNYVVGKESVNLAKKIEKYLPEAIVAVSALDIVEIVKETKLKVFAQHIDVVASQTKSTGFITSETAKKSGAIGSLLNHSEHQISYKLILGALNDLAEQKMKAIVCVTTLKEANALIKLRPWAMAFEDAELIATGKSITNYRKEEIIEFVKLLKKTKIIPLCGAGISSAEDIKTAKKLGCKGVLIASAIANSKNPEKLLGEIAKVK